MGSLSLTLLASALGLVIEGTTTCPTTDEVGAALRPLLREEISGAEDRLALSKTLRGLQVRLIDSHGELLAQRLLPPMSGCAAQAHRVAVIAATWQAEVSEEPLPLAPEVPPATAGLPVDLETSEVRESEARRNARLWPSAEPQPAHPRPAFLGLGYRLSFSPIGGVTSVLHLEGGAIWGRWGIQGGGWFELARAVSNDSEHDNFGRIAAEFGPTLVVWSSQPEVQVRVQAVGALLDARAVYFDPGIEAGARVLPGYAPARVFLDVATVLWPRFLVEQPGAQLSPFELFLTVGLFLGSV